MAKRKKAKKKQNTQGCYDPRMAKQVSAIIELLPLARCCGLPFNQIARCLGVSVRTMLKWRKPASDCFKRDFAKAVERAASKKFRGLGIENR